MKTIILVLIYIIYGCNHDGYQQTENDRGESCTVSESGTISCPDGTSYQIPTASSGPTQGPAGEVGQEGAPGRDGHDGVNGSPGRDGQSIVGPRGEQGIPGAAGVVGPAGRDGTNCTVNDTGVITCGDSVYQIPAGSQGPQGSPGPSGAPGTDGQDGNDGSDGQDGTDGVDGTNGQDGATGAPGTPGTVITPVFPCPTLAGSYPEVLLCISTKLYAVFAPGNSNVRYVEIGPGNYVTTDGRSCSFRVVTGCTIQ